MNFSIFGEALKDKTKAFLCHIVFSVIVFVVVVFILVYFWFPPPYFTMDGGWRGLRIVAFVDIVAGPLLTFCVFKVGKKGLKLDLALIFVLQFLALSYGVMTLYSNRTVSMVYVHDSIYVIAASVYANSGIDIDVLDEIEGAWPKFVYMDISRLDDNEVQAFLKLSTRSQHYILETEYYETPSLFIDNIITKARDMNYHLEKVPEAIEQVDEFLNEYGGALGDYAFIPLYARYYNYHLGIHKKSKKVVGVLEVEVPFPDDIPYISVVQENREKAATKSKLTQSEEGSVGAPILSM